MPNRRIVSIWFPRFGAERLLRMHHQTIDHPFSVVEDHGQMQVLSSLSVSASQEGLQIGQPLRDAQAMCPTLMTRLRNKQAEEFFLRALARWAGKFSPWVVIEKPDSLLLDITGCTHLFRGEEAFLNQVQSDTRDLGLTTYTGLADTPGAAWALARYTGKAIQSHRSGDAIEQEARATRSRSAKRHHWERISSALQRSDPHQKIQNIALPGKTYSALQSLPVAALRIDQTLVEGLNRLGLRRIGDLSGQPRASLARRFGKGLVEQLDKALGSLPEPISPLKQTPHFGVRLSLPEPIGLIDDLVSAIDRLLPRLCMHLRCQSQGARRVLLQCFHTDNTVTNVNIGLARANNNPDRIRPLLLLKLNDIEAGFGIDVVRLEATGTEALHQSESKGQLTLQSDSPKVHSPTKGLEDLVGKLGGRIGLENITRYHPANSHIPEKTFQILAAAWSEAAEIWPDLNRRRPMLLWWPEPVKAPESPIFPREFQWRGRTLRTRTAQGPERIAPEWWLDDPNWRSGVRDYWQVTCKEGDLLWLFYAHGATVSAGWFCQGSFT